MSLTLQNPLTLSLYFPKNTPCFKNPNYLLLFPCTHFRILKTQLPNPHNFTPFHNLAPLKAFQSNRVVQDDSFNLDSFLPIAEVLCLASSVVISIGSALNFVFLKKFSAWQFLLLVGGVAVGVVIRKRQWSRICMDFSKPSGSGVNLVERIEKLEEDIKSSVTIVRVLSRQLEKLGIRFRVTRKALKQPIAEPLSRKADMMNTICLIAFSLYGLVPINSQLHEGAYSIPVQPPQHLGHYSHCHTLIYELIINEKNETYNLQPSFGDEDGGYLYFTVAIAPYPYTKATALAQKNSEATRALAEQEVSLEKELGEIQKFLLAMQDQQQKQLELICAIGKTRKLWEGNKEPSKDQDKKDKNGSATEEGLKQIPVNQIQRLDREKEPNSERR
ncbi:hypothetical protein LguiA_003179 [Lonicera macranthoides]